MIYVIFVVARKSMLQILLVNRLEMARNAAKLYLSRYADEWQVVAEAADEASLLAQLKSSCPDVVILYIDVVKRPLSELIIQLRAICPEISVIVTSGDPDMETIVLKAGANAFLYLGNSPASLVTKLRIIQSENM